MNNTDIYDRNLFKDKFKELYNSTKFNFTINNNMLSNIITKWKSTSNRFNKSTIWDNIYDKQMHLILRDFRSVFESKNNKSKINCNEYVIWANDENLKRMRKSNHYYIDCTFHHPKEYKQLLIVMYKDIITDLKIPGIYILLNNKTQSLYNLAFESLINILTENNTIDLDIKSIITDSEAALFKTVEKFFPNSLRISCYFHYKQDILRNLRKFGLYKDIDKKESDLILNKLGSLPFLYKGNISLIEKFLDKLIDEHPKYNNFINEYFKTNKLIYFKNFSLDYSKIPQDCRTNNYLENYNGYIKSQLGKNRIINWVNFINFIKDESIRSVDKLFNKNNINAINFYDSSISSDKKNINRNDITKDNKENINQNQDFTNIEILDKNNKEIINNKTETIKLDILNTLNSFIGIINLGASCYINSSIQVMLHCKDLIESLSKKEVYIKTLKSSISYMFIKICYYIINAQKNKNHYIDISFFVNNFSTKHSNFTGLIQNDCIEFLRTLFEDISLELNESKKIYIYKMLNNEDSLSKKLSYMEYLKLANDKEKSIITETFYPIFITIYQCECKKELYRFQNMFDIPLLLPDDRDSTNLKQLLDDYFKVDYIDFEYKCQKCNNILPHRKILKLCKIPNILVFSFQRFDIQNNIKNNIKVSFPEILNVNDYINEIYSDKIKSSHNLYAIITHEGN